MSPRLVNSLTYLFFFVVSVLACGVYFEVDQIILLSRVIGLSIIMLLYYLTSLKKNKLYLFSLFFSLLSILFLFIKSETGILSATIFFLLFIILTTKIVIKNSSKIKFIPVVLGFLPFLSILFYLIFLTYSSLGINYIPAIINALLLSFLGGLAVSNYVLEDNIRNIWLLMSMLLFTLLIFVFMIEKYYLEVQVFKPIRTVCFFAGHYLFMRYILLSEHHTIMDFPCEITDESVSK